MYKLIALVVKQRFIDGDWENIEFQEFIIMDYVDKTLLEHADDLFNTAIEFMNEHKITYENHEDRRVIYSLEFMKLDIWTQNDVVNYMLSQQVGYM